VRLGWRPQYGLRRFSLVATKGTKKVSRKKAQKAQNRKPAYVLFVPFCG
jgi:hypothetical protein